MKFKESTHLCPDSRAHMKTEELIKNETKATIRLIPFGDGEEGTCMVTGKPSKKRVVFARSY